MFGVGPVIAATVLGDTPDVSRFATEEIAHKHSQGHASYQRKVAEGKTPAEARWALRRKISNAIWTELQADARTRATGGSDPT